MTTVHAYAALSAGAPLTPFAYDLPALGPGEVDIAVRWCGICHSDLSMLNNDWRISSYPLVAGHEVVGTIEAVGAGVNHLRPGQTVGLGWYTHSCLTCFACTSGDHNLCATAEGTIVGRHGGFANRVRAHAEWVMPLPEGVDANSAGPLFCGGITVFNPLLQNGIRPTDRIGIVGIGGLGHLALRFSRAWGCEVWAFSTSADKEAEARTLGAHHFVNTHEPDALAKLAGKFDLILVTVNVPLDWDAYIAALRPRGKLHIVGAAPSVTAAIFPLISGQKSVGGSPVGSPAALMLMLDFAARHGIAPVVEHFPMHRVNDALEHLRAGKARYRLILDNDAP